MKHVRQTPPVTTKKCYGVETMAINKCYGGIVKIFISAATICHDVYQKTNHFMKGVL